MVRRICIKLNLSVLITHLSREEGHAVSKDEAICWLSDAGFSRIDDEHWVVDEPNLGQLDPSEVLEALPINEPA